MDWYEAQEVGLGDGFVIEADVAFKAIAQRPYSFSVVRGKVRRAALNRFPYGIFFFVRRKEIEVIGVYHARQSPERWTSRGK